MRKNVTAISSIESVKMSRPAAMSESFRLGSVTRQNVCHGVAPRSSEASSCDAVDFLQAGEEFGGGDGNERRAVTEKNSEQAERQVNEDGEHQ